MGIDDDQELVELVSSALKSLSVAQFQKRPPDFASVRRNEASIAKMVSSLSSYRSGSSSSDEMDRPGIT